jgi:hypothetical protein
MTATLPVLLTSLVLALSSAPFAELQDAPKQADPGARTPFSKKDRDDFVKKVREYLEPVEDRADAKERDGADSDKYKAADKKAKAAEAALKTFLKNKGKDYKIDSECLAATAEWQNAFSEFLAYKSKFTKADKTLGVEQVITLRDDPKNTYTRRIPKSYDPAKKAWPLLLMVQDKGKSSKSLTTEDWKSSVLLEGEGEAQGYITVVIDVPESAWEDSGKLHAAILKPLKDARSLFRVDTRRIAIGGIGAGVRAAASAFLRYPHAFSAFVAKGGDPGDVLPENFVNVPVFVAGDAAGFDREVEDGAGGKAKWSARAGALKVDYTANANASADDVAKWLNTKTRDCYPAHVMSAMKTERRQRAAVWLVYDPDPAKVARIDATADRATNTITVQCDGINRYYLFLCDALVDLSKPIVVKTNDQERKISVPPTFETLMENFHRYYAGVDWGGIFTSIPQPIDVPRKKTPAAPTPTPGDKGGDKGGEKGNNK